MTESEYIFEIIRCQFNFIVCRLLKKHEVRPQQTTANNTDAVDSATIYTVGRHSTSTKTTVKP